MFQHEGTTYRWLLLQVCIVTPHPLYDYTRSATLPPLRDYSPPLGHKQMIHSWFISATHLISSVGNFHEIHLRCRMYLIGPNGLINQGYQYFQKFVWMTMARVSRTFQTLKNNMSY